MLSIRLSRVGKKHQPLYRVIVLDARKDPWGDYLENLGFYDPMKKSGKFNAERIKYWISVGAKPTTTVWNLLVGKQVISGSKKKLTRGGKKKEVPAAA